MYVITSLPGSVKVQMNAKRKMAQDGTCSL